MIEIPVVNFHFRVEWGSERIGFSEVSGLKAEQEVIEYRNGADPTFSAQKVPGLRKFSNIVLKRGAFKDDNDIFKWFNQTDLEAEKRDVVISLLDNQHEPSITWNIRNAWPVVCRYSKLNAMKSEILIETLELTHEGFTVERAGE
jgi:phage tail-like protein